MGQSATWTRHVHFEKEGPLSRASRQMGSDRSRMVHQLMYAQSFIFISSHVPSIGGIPQCWSHLPDTVALEIIEFGPQIEVRRLMSKAQASRKGIELLH